MEKTVEWIGFAVNDMDNAIMEIDYNDPMTFFDIEKLIGEVISKELKCNTLKKNSMSLIFHLVNVFFPKNDRCNCL